MSYGYGYGYGYGEETTTPDYEEDYGAEMEEDDSSSSPLGMAFILVPLLDGAAWYVTNDKWAATVSQWTDAKNSMLGSAVVCGLAAVGNLAAPDAVEAFFPILAGLGGVWNLANLYLIKRGEDASASTTNSTKIAYGLSAAGALLSFGAAATAGGSGDDAEEDDEYYGAEGGDDNTDSGNSYGGYYSYY